LGADKEQPELVAVVDLEVVSGAGGDEEGRATVVHDGRNLTADEPNRPIWLEYAAAYYKKKKKEEEIQSSVWTKGF